MLLFSLSSFILMVTWSSRQVYSQLVSSNPSSVTQLSSTTSGSRPIFTVPSSADDGLNVIPNVKDPEAISAQEVCPGYTATDIKESARGFTAKLDLAGPACHLYGNDVDSLTLAVTYEAGDRLNVKIQPRYISPENETWFVLPEALVPRPTAELNATAATSKLELSWSNDPTFSFTVVRRETGDVIFTTAGSVLVYEDQFIEFVSHLPENYNLYGLGEVIHGFRLGDNLTRTLFAADVGDTIDANIYGSHPIYLDTRYFVENETDGFLYTANGTDVSLNYTSFTHGVFLRNAHAQEILLQQPGITWRTLGGSIELYFFAGPSAQGVIQSYQRTTVGLPAMQQYWTFGYHQCRWGYENWTVLQEVVDQFAKFQLPLETIWTDIDYMNQYRDFENDAVRFNYSEGARFLDRLHANDQHYVPIIDSAIYAPNYENESDAYPPYERGIDAEAFMLNPDGSIYYGAVWPGYTVFPDWIGAVLNNTGAIDWWLNEVSLWHEMVNFDGIWIDMSEVSSFCVGSCGSDNLTLNPVHPPFSLPGEPGNLVLSYPEGFNLTNATEAASASSLSYAQAHPSTTTSTASSAASSTTSYFRTNPTPGARNINWPPYAINHINGDLAVHAVSPNATHHGGTQEYDFHNLFGHQILKATYQALLEVFPGRRPFIVGRSTFAGTGKFAAHWGGDNTAQWTYMYFSIPQALSFSIFGIPMFGVDTCGFAGNTDYELCSRWMQLSAFFPFYRNHNTLAAISQEPYIWSSVLDASRTAMRIRYSLLPYLYTLFSLANKDGSTVMRALAWEFPNEPWLAGADRQFLLGDAIMVIPCLTQGAATVAGVFPGVGDGTTVWYDWYDRSEVIDVQPGQNVTLKAPLGHIPLYLRGGTVIPIQEPGLTTTASRRGGWGLIVSLNLKGAARGTLYLDDGESLMPEETKWVDFRATKTSLAAQPRGTYEDGIPLGNVTVLGLGRKPKSVSLNGGILDSTYWTYNDTSYYLILSRLDDLFLDGAWCSSWILTWT